MRERGLHAKPFAIVEQREMARLRDLGAKPIHIAALVALRVRQDANGEVRDSYATLGRWTGMSEPTMKLAIAWLVTRHIVVQLDRERAHGVGAAWRWPRRVVSFEMWQASPNAENVPLWRQEQRAPTFEEVLRFKTAGGRL